jgi:hypothetical protein
MLCGKTGWFPSDQTQVSHDSSFRGEKSDQSRAVFVGEIGADGLALQRGNRPLKRMGYVPCDVLKPVI